ncbi:MAG: response regulator [Desulfobacteraceae bacterium]|nr:response regulator [Desulfobacteraceae bacterium]
MFFKRARILIIDDEEVIRDSSTQALVKEGHIIKGAENGDLGLKLFREFRPDIVLIDLKMPGKSGMEVLEEIDTADPNVVKVVITGFATVSSAVDAMKKGAYDFIPKPFTPEEIRLIVARGLERRRLLLEAEALRIEQEKIRRNMISLVSHELRAPLAATVQYLEVILSGMGGKIPLKTKKLIDRCDIRLKEMLELLGRWLNLATFDPVKMAEHFQDVSLSDVANESIELMKPLSEEKNITVTLEAPDDLFPIKGSKVSLEEIFNNLISNAIKYNKEGSLTKVKLYEDDQEICVEISDNGTGIPEEHLSRIFDEFYRVDGRRNAPVKGSGLGLSIVKKMVDAHGGIIDVESEFGKGTTFKIRFPKVFVPQKED